jgi:3-phosphoshikimate 1-carboxyvinyltransferase
MPETPRSYPDKLEVKPLERPPVATVRVPGSKSITNRALVLAALASQQGPCTIRGALQSEDTEVMIDSLLRLGFVVCTDWPNHAVIVGHNHGPIIPVQKADLFVANSGTTMRFLTALVSLGHGRYRLDGVPRMRERPVRDLLDALTQLGVDARSETGNGCPPVLITAKGLSGGEVHIRGDVSSQFLSALMMVSPYASSPVTIIVDGPLFSEPYVQMTQSMLLGRKAFWLDTSNRQFPIPNRGLAYCAEELVEPDATAASYFYAAAAICAGDITVAGIPIWPLQGDIAFVNVLERMGCRTDDDAEVIRVIGAPLCGIDVDMNRISDTVMTLAAVACFADGPTTIRNVAHIRHKETDRLAALATELRRVGAEVEEFADGLTITPRPLHGAEIETYNDHRMAMSMALIGLRVPGIVIKDPGCVAKTYPGFWEDFEKLRQS